MTQNKTNQAYVIPNKARWELTGVVISGFITAGIVALMLGAGLLNGMESIFILIFIIFLSLSFIGGIALMVLWEVKREV